VLSVVSVVRLLNYLITEGMKLSPATAFDPRSAQPFLLLRAP